MLYRLTATSRLKFDDSEKRELFLGEFFTENLDKLTLLIDMYWDYIGEEVMTPHVVDAIRAALLINESLSGSIEYEEPMEIIEFPGGQRIFTFSFEAKSVPEEDEYFGRNFGSDLSTVIKYDDNAKAGLMTAINSQLMEISDIKSVSVLEFENGVLKLDIRYNADN